MRATGAVLLVVAFLVAGCAGNEDPGAPSGGDESPVGGGPKIHNGIEGIVQSEDLLPLERATVEILSLGLNVTTNTQGQYRFVNLDPRDYLVVASKDGYKTLTQRAIVQPDTIHQLDFRLDPRPTLKPYDEAFPAQGLISCKFVYGMDPESMQHQDCGSLDPNNQVVHEFSIGPHAAQIVAEAFWEPTTDGSKHLMLTLESVGFGHQDVLFGSISGPSGIKISVPQTIVEKYYSDGGVIRTRMDAAPSITGDEAGADGGVAIQQGFEVVVTVFYVEPGPSTYTYKPEP